MLYFHLRQVDEHSQDILKIFVFIMNWNLQYLLATASPSTAQPPTDATTSDPSTDATTADPPASPTTNLPATGQNPIFIM